MYIFFSVQCSEERYARDVSELYSSPNIQTRPLYRPEPQENSGYDYPRPAPVPQPSPPVIVRPAPRPEIIVDPVYPPPQPRPIYPQPQPVYPQPQPTYPQPRPIYPQPEPVYPQPQPVYPQPQPVYPQPRPIYPQPQPVYPQPTYPQTEVLFPSRPVPVIPEPELAPNPSTGYDYPKPYAVEQVQSTGAATGTSEKFFWPFTNKYGPPSNNYPGSNSVGYPNGNYPHKFSFLDSIFPFKNNYNGQKLEAPSSSIAVASTSSFDQGFNNIGNNAISSSGYDYPNPNEQKPPFDIPGVIQFRKEPVNRK